MTAGQFLILTGIILPLLADEPVTTLRSITWGWTTSRRPKASSWRVSAVARSAPSRKVVVSSERAAGAIKAAPPPWTSRAPTSSP